MTKHTRERSSKRNQIINQITAVVFSVVIFVALSTVAFAGGMKVEGAKAVSKAFKTVTVSWDEVLIEAPEEPAEPSEETTTEPSTEGNGDATEPVTDETAEPVTDVPAADMADETTAVIAGEEAADLTDEEAADPTDETIADPQYIEMTYMVYRATAKKGKYKCVATTTETQFKDHKVKVGKTKELNIKVKPAGAKVTFKSSDKNVVKVSKDGKITGINAGKATVTVSGDGVEFVVKVTVK